MVYSENSETAHCTVPDLGVSAEALLEYKQKAFSRTNTLRVRRLEEKVRNILYYYNRQWLELDGQLQARPGIGYSFRDLRHDDRNLPRPVTNYIAPAVNTEMAALGRRQLTANVICKSRDPRAEAAAKQAKEILDDRLKKLNWSDLREHFTWLTIVCGMAILKSYWEETSTDISYMDNPEALMCLDCGIVLSRPNVSAEDVSKAEAAGQVSRHLRTSMPVSEPGEELEAGAEPEAGDDEAETGETYHIEVCPYCEEERPLSPLSLDNESARELDFYGRPLGIAQPKGQTALEVVSLFDFFPENAGINVDWNTMSLWRQATPRSVDWVLTRWPHLKGKISPEDPRELMKNHPVLGEWDFIGRYDPRHDADLFANHVMVYEVWQDRNWRFPDGRGFVLVGDCSEPAYDGPLYKSNGAVSCPIVKYAGANWEPKHLEIWGKALPDDLISPQNRINMLDALELDAIGRTGSPNMIAPSGSNLNGAAWFDEATGKIYFYDVDPLNPQAKPEILEPRGLAPNGQNARQQAVNDMQILSGPQPIEQGEAPKNITTTSGLQLLGENAEKKRAHRERSLISAFEKIWTHQLDLLWAFREEPDSYEAKTYDGSFEQREFTKASLMGQTKVLIEKQAEIDKSLYQREAVREAMADGLYLADSLHAKKRILELKGLPTDVNEDINYQIDSVKKQWVDFVEQGLVPVIDPSLDDPVIRFQGFSTFLLSDEGQRTSEQAGWPSLLKQLHGWEARVKEAEALDQQSRQLYGNDPAAAEQMFAQQQMAHQEAMGQWQQVSQAGSQLAAEGGSAPEMGAPPAAPMQPVFLAGDRADHIFGVWQQMLGAGQMGAQFGAPMGAQPSPMTPPPVLNGPTVDPNSGAATQETYLRFRAVVEAFRLMRDEKLLAVTPVPGVGPSAPGGEPAPDIQGGVPQLGQLNVASK